MKELLVDIENLPGCESQFHEEHLHALMPLALPDVARTRLLYYSTHCQRRDQKVKHVHQSVQWWIQVGVTGYNIKLCVICEQKF